MLERFLLLWLTLLSLLAMDVFSDVPATAIAPALYTFGCMFTGTILARCWAEFGRKEEEGGGE